MTDIIEAIAQRWFETCPQTQSPSWAAQPEQVREVFRERARDFWRSPGRLHDALKETAIWTRQATTAIERVTG